MNLDFETYSEAGLRYSIREMNFVSANVDGKSNKKSISLVGAYAYAEHPSTRVTVACYSFDLGKTVLTWRPGEEPPADLLDHVKQGGKITAWNSFFEWSIWNKVCVRLYGWPDLPIAQTIDSMATAVSWSLPSALDKASTVIFGESEKDAKGKKVMLALSQPRKPTKNDPRLRPEREDSEAWRHLDSYCAQDVRAEINIAQSIPPLSVSESEVWQVDQEINARGVGIDLPLVNACLKIMRECKSWAATTIRELTNGKVTEVSQATALLKWVNDTVPDKTLKSLEVDDSLQPYLDEHTLPANVIEVLELRRDVGGSAPAKLIAMKYQAAKDGRIHGILQYGGAQRTRRWAGRGIQTQNMPVGGPKVSKCSTCDRVVHSSFNACYCGGKLNPLEWGIEGVEAVIPSLETGNFDYVEALWRNPAKVVSGCLRSMLVPAKGMDYLSSDYSAIEAVVMACMAGEQWIIDVFFGDGKLYERTGSKIAGIAIEDILKHKTETGAHDPARKIGKVAALASQFQGARGAWLKFGAGKFLSNEEIDKAVRAWRAASPAIVAYWYNVETAALNAVQNPGGAFPVSGANVIFQVKGRALYCVLPCGDWLTYVDPKIVQRKKLSSDGWRAVELCEYLEAKETALDREELQILLAPELFSRIEKAGYKVSSSIRSSLTAALYQWGPTLTYWGVGTQKKWMQQDTYGGKLAENITQATARFILSNALVAVEKAGYPIVMHAHDEIVTEVPEGTGSIEELERIMSIMPPWATLPDGRPWPIKAKGGWRGKRFRK